MTPVTCRVKHDPENGTYGDCMRACIATLLDLDAEAVPHFFHDGKDEEGGKRLTEWLAGQGYYPFRELGPRDMTLEDVLHYQSAVNPHAHYILYGSTGSGGTHVVVCKGGAVVHNPAWYGSHIVGPPVGLDWQIMVLARL